MSRHVYGKTRLNNPQKNSCHPWNIVSRFPDRMLACSTSQLPTVAGLTE
jgi:hypothetical protein